LVHDVFAVDLGDFHVRRVIPVGPGEVAVELFANLSVYPDGHVTSVGLKPVFFETKSVTVWAALSALIVEPQPARSIASEVTRIANAVRIAAVFHK
jgi:hypothetical protein